MAKWESEVEVNGAGGCGRWTTTKHQQPARHKTTRRAGTRATYVAQRSNRCREVIYQARREDRTWAQSWASPAGGMHRAIDEHSSQTRKLTTGRGWAMEQRGLAQRRPDFASFAPANPANPCPFSPSFYLLPFTGGRQGIHGLGRSRDDASTLRFAEPPRPDRATPDVLPIGAWGGREARPKPCQRVIDNTEAEKPLRSRKPPRKA